MGRTWAAKAILGIEIFIASNSVAILVTKKFGDME